MRWFVAGLDVGGRSVITSAGEQHLSDDPAPVIERILATDQSPPPSVPSGAALHRDLGVGTGLVQWRIVRWGPGFSLPMHSTDTIDLDCVIEGAVELVLDDGAHPLRPGDCVAVAGVDHAWRTGDTGCVLAIALIGATPRPAQVARPPRDSPIRP